MQQSWDLNPVSWLKTPCPYPFCFFRAATQNHSAWCQADFTIGQTQGFLNQLICILSAFWQEGSNRTIWSTAHAFLLNSVFWAHTLGCSDRLQLCLLNPKVHMVFTPKSTLVDHLLHPESSCPWLLLCLVSSYPSSSYRQHLSSTSTVHCSKQSFIKPATLLAVL